MCRFRLSEACFALKKRFCARHRLRSVEWFAALEARRLFATVAGATFNDYDADGLQDPREPGLSGRTVYIDANQNGQPDGPSPVQQFGSTDTPLAIPDGVGYVDSTIVIPGMADGITVDLNVSISIAHTNNADLTAYLFSPNGQGIILFSGVGGSGDGIDIVLDDEASLFIFSLPIGSPATGSYRPASALSQLDGESLSGSWTLRVQDSLTGEAGTLTSWGLSITPGEPTQVTNGSGRYSFSGLSPGQYAIRQVVPANWLVTQPTGANTVTVDSVEDLVTGINFGTRQPPGTVSGAVFGDYDSDGTRDVNEPGLQGWTVYLDFDNDHVADADEDQAVTAADGSFVITDVPPGSYTIRQVLQPGYTPTSPSTPAAARAATVSAITRTYSTESVVARFDALRGLREIDRYLLANPSSLLARMLDLSASAQMFKLQGDSLVELNLRDGVDPAAAVKQLELLPIVRWASLNYSYDTTHTDPRDFSTNDPSYNQQYHHPLQQTDQAWDTTLGDPRVIIAVTDDGFALSHPDLYQNVWINQAEIPATRRANLTDINGDGYISMLELNDPVNIGPFKANDVNSDNRIDYSDLLANLSTTAGQDNGGGGWTDGLDQGVNGFADDIVGRDFWTNDNDPSPQNGFDDHGTHVTGIAAARTNNAVGVAGVAGGATFMPIRFWGSPGAGWTSTIVANAYAYAVNNGAKIVTTSYTVDQFVGDPTFESALAYMYSQGALHFNSAGNTNTANPARQALDYTLYVANTDGADLKFAGSNYGWGIDLSAPGTSIFSTSYSSSSLGSFSYETKTGTSMSSPNAAAAAALIWSIHPEWTRDQVAARLIGSADDIDAVNPLFAGQLGSGRVNTRRAVSAAPLFPPRLRGLAIGGSIVSTNLTTLSLDTRNVLTGNTVNNAAFSLRYAGLDAQFGTADDSIIPLNLTTTVRVGTNRLGFSVGSNLLPGKYRFSAAASIADPFGQPLDGNGDGVGGDDFTQDFSVQYGYATTVTVGESTTGVLFGNRDVVRPQTTGAAFTFSTGQVIRFNFSEDVLASLAAGDLTLENLTTGQTISPTDLAVSYDAATNQARFTYLGSANGALPDGNYRATLAAGVVADPYGNPTAAGTTLEFFALAGDADRNRSVNIDDFGVLAARFNQPGTFAEGDFDYTGTVDVDDFAILASRFNGVLPSSPGVGPRMFSGNQVVEPAHLPPLIDSVQI